MRSLAQAQAVQYFYTQPDHGCFKHSPALLHVQSTWLHQHGLY